MDNLYEMFPPLMAYQPALLALTILCLAVLVQSFLAGVIGLGKSDEEPGRPLKGGHGDFSFRTLRTYANSVENLAVFGLIVLLAMFAGASASWVNWLVGSHVAFRLAYWAVYYSGAGKIAGGPRTILYVLGWFANLVLAVVTLFAFL